MLIERIQHWKNEVEATYVVAKLAWRAFLKKVTPDARQLYVAALAEHFTAKAFLAALTEE